MSKASEAPWDQPEQYDTVVEKFSSAANRGRGNSRGRGGRGSSRSKTSMTQQSGPPPRGFVEEGTNDDAFDITEFRGAVETTARYGNNLDFSNYMLLVEASYAHITGIDPVFERQIPFAMYQHYHVMLLFAKLNEVAIHQNKQPLHPSEGSLQGLIPDQIPIHAPLHAYLENLGTCTTPTGDTVYINLPESVIPQQDRQAEAGIPAIDPGSFGPIVAANHNAYECVPSPLISRRFVEQSIENGGDAWQPLPDGAYPGATIPNENLLGWHPTQALHHEAVRVLRRIVWDEETPLHRRYSYSANLMGAVMGRLNDMASGIRPRIKVKHGIPPPAISMTTTGVLVARENVVSAARISQVASRVSQPYQTSIQTTKRFGILGMRRLRHEQARGLSYTNAQGNSPHGWAGTINNR